MVNFDQWNGFKGRLWKEEINVRDFVQNNYKPYDGDESFLEGPTEATNKLWGRLQELQKEERAKGGVLDMETKVVAGLTAYGPGYIDESMKELEQVVGLQTDKPLKRAFMPYGGIKMAEESCKNYGYEPDPELHKIFTEYHKTHNQGVFDAYTPEMKKARHNKIITGLPDTYGRGRIVGDYRRVALYGIDFLIEQKVNDYIWMNQEVNIFYPDERQRKLIPYRSKKELTGEIRLVEFPGADLCACCGLHVTHASQIGLVKILSSKKFRDGVRMEMLSGKRALEYLSKSAEQNSQVAVRLSVKEKETKDAVQRLLDEVYNLKGELAAEKQKHFEQIAASCVGKENVLLIEEDMEPVEVRKCTDAILDTCSGVAAFFAGNDKDGYKYAIGQRKGDVRELVKQVNKELNGRGGGKPFFAQGSLKATRKQIEIFFEKKVNFQ